MQIDLHIQICQKCRCPDQIDQTLLFGKTVDGRNPAGFAGRTIGAAPLDIQRRVHPVGVDHHLVHRHTAPVQIGAVESRRQKDALAQGRGRDLVNPVHGIIGITENILGMGDEGKGHLGFFASGPDHVGHRRIDEMRMHDAAPGPGQLLRQIVGILHALPCNIEIRFEIREGRLFAVDLDVKALLDQASQLIENEGF